MDDLSVDDLFGDDLSVDDLSVDDLSVDDLSVDYLSVDDLSVDDLSALLIGVQPCSTSFWAGLACGLYSLVALPHSHPCRARPNFLRTGDRSGSRRGPSFSLTHHLQMIGRALHARACGGHRVESEGLSPARALRVAVHTILDDHPKCLTYVPGIYTWYICIIYIHIYTIQDASRSWRFRPLPSLTRKNGSQRIGGPII